jgi:transcriptional regulator with XRE-family HTH domain
MFEIGSSLREARMRRGLELSQVERDTRIRPRYLMALEEEQFDVLPGPAYTRGFLRTYADYLGLDAQRFIDEYNSRFAPEEEPAGAAPVRIQRPRRLTRWLVVVPIALILALIGWQATRGSPHHTTAPPPPTTTQIVKHLKVTPPSKPKIARLSLVASRGRCWVEVRRFSATGPIVFLRTLEQGETTRVNGVRLWVRFGAPWNVDATVNGKTAQLPSALGNVVVTASGVTSG